MLPSTDKPISRPPGRLFRVRTTFGCRLVRSCCSPNLIALSAKPTPVVKVVKNQMTDSNGAEAGQRNWSDSFFVHVDEARGRRPIDVVTAIAGALLVLVTAINADQISWLQSLIDTFIAQFPAWLNTTFVIVYLVGLLYAITIIVLVVVQGGRRLTLLRDLGIAGLLAFGLTTVLSQLVSNTWPVLLPEILDQVDPIYPVVRVGTVTALLIVAGPHLVRPMRRTGWLMVALLTLAALDLGYGLTTDVLGGIGVGLLSAGLVLVIFGSPRGYPNRPTSLGRCRCWESACHS